MISDNTNNSMMTTSSGFHMNFGKSDSNEK